MTFEVERTWLVPGDAPLARARSSVDVRQGYLVVTNEVEVRVRAAGATYLLAVKTGSGLRRGEVELPIVRDQFDALWSATEDARIVKTRHVVGVGDHRAEVDVFSDGLAGLVLVEVEFDSVEAAGAFEPPAWFGREVTDAEGWNNASLAVHGVPVGG
jgi:adenylate cyclase